MQRFQFRLKALMKYRKLLTEQFQAELGRATAAWQSELTLLTTHIDNKQQLENSLRDLQQKPIPVDSLITCHIYGKRLKELIIHQQESVNNAERRCNTCREQLSEALKRQKLVEKLKEKRWLQYTEEQLQYEQKQLDEIGLQLYVRGE